MSVPYWQIADDMEENQKQLKSFPFLLKKNVAVASASIKPIEKERVSTLQERKSVSDNSPPVSPSSSVIQSIFSAGKQFVEGLLTNSPSLVGKSANSKIGEKVVIHDNTQTLSPASLASLIHVSKSSSQQHPDFLLSSSSSIIQPKEVIPISQRQATASASPQRVPNVSPRILQQKEPIITITELVDAKSDKISQPEETDSDATDVEILTDVRSSSAPQESDEEFIARINVHHENRILSKNNKKIRKNGIIENEEKQEKKQRKSKKRSIIEDEVVVDEALEDAGNEEEEQKQRKSKKRSIPVDQEEDVEQEEEEQKQRKSKKRSIPEDDEEVVEDAEEAEDGVNEEVEQEDNDDDDDNKNKKLNFSMQSISKCLTKSTSVKRNK